MIPPLNPEEQADLAKIAEYLSTPTGLEFLKRPDVAQFIKEGQGFLADDPDAFYQAIAMTLGEEQIPPEMVDLTNAITRMCVRNSPTLEQRAREERHELIADSLSCAANLYFLFTGNSLSDREVCRMRSGFEATMPPDVSSPRLARAILSGAEELSTQVRQGTLSRDIGGRYVLEIARAYCREDT